MRGVDAINQLASGEITDGAADDGILTKVRDKIVDEVDELVKVGARVRPLALDEKHVGWVRGVSVEEYRWMKRYLDPMKSKDTERFVHIALRGTTLTKDEILDLAPKELFSLVSLIKKLSDADMSLYPYIGPYSTTLASEKLWETVKVKPDMYNPQKIETLDGKVFQIPVVPESITGWFLFASRREQYKIKMDNKYNSAIIVKGMIGKGGDNFMNSVVKTIKGMDSNSLEPWRELIDTQTVINRNDGWAHGFQANSVQDMLKEMSGWEKGDRHEKVMDAFYKQVEENDKKVEEVLASKPMEMTESFKPISADELAKVDELARRTNELRQAIVKGEFDAVEESEARSERRKPQPFMVFGKKKEQ